MGGASRTTSGAMTVSPACSGPGTGAPASNRLHLAKRGRPQSGHSAVTARLMLAAVAKARARS